MNNCILCTNRFGEPAKTRSLAAYIQLGQSMQTAEIISAAEIGTITVIDLRDLVEIHSSGWASGALHIPLAKLAHKADPNSPEHDPRLQPSKPVAVYSAAGGRSAKGKKILSDLGYHVENIGGFYDWAVAGGAITR